MILEDVLCSSNITDTLRGSLLEASHRYVPGSAAELVFRFEQAIREYFVPLLQHEFQLYSDVPKYFFRLTGLFIHLQENNEQVIVSLVPGVNNSISPTELEFLNNSKLSDFFGVDFQFALNPNLKSLKSAVENCPNSKLLTQDRDFTVNCGNQSCKGKFKPSWGDAGVFLRMMNLSMNAPTDLHMLKFSGYT